MYFQVDEFDVFSDNKEADLQHHVAFFSAICDDCYDSVDQNDRDYSFLRFAPCDSYNDSDIEYENLDFSIMSNMNDDNIDVSSMDHRQGENSVKPTALVAHVSYDNENDSTNWIIDSGSTHHMNGFANEFLNMTLEGYDGLLVKGLVSGTQAYGIGSYIVVVKDSARVFRQICLEDVLYVPNLIIHHHPRFFSVISACSQY